MTPRPPAWRRFLDFAAWLAGGEALPPAPPAGRDPGVPFFTWLAASETLPPPPEPPTRREETWLRWLCRPDKLPPASPGREEGT